MKATRMNDAGTDMSPALPSHEEISARAYELYMERPAGEGRALDDWLRAESELAGLRETDVPGPAIVRRAPVRRPVAHDFAGK